MALRPPYQLAAKTSLWHTPHAKNWESRSDARITSITHLGDEIIASTMGGDVFFLTQLLLSDAPLRIEEPVCSVFVHSGVLKVCTRDGVKEYAKTSRALLKEYQFAPGNAVAFLSRKKVDFVVGATGAILKHDWSGPGKPQETLYTPAAETATTRAALGPTWLVTTGLADTATFGSADTLEPQAQVPLRVAGQAEGKKTHAVAWHDDTGNFFIDTEHTLQIYAGGTVSKPGEWLGEKEHTQNLSPKTRLVAKGSFLCRASGRTLEVYNAATMELITVITPSWESDISALAMKEHRLAVGTEGGEVFLYNLRKLGGVL